MTENVHSVPAVEAAMPAPVRESDNPVMKGLLFLRSSAASAPSLTRGLWQCYGRERAAAVRNFLGQYRPHPALYLTLALAVFGAVTFAQTHSPSVIRSSPSTAMSFGQSSVLAHTMSIWPWRMMGSASS